MEVDMLRLEGSMVAIVTPFVNDEIDIDALRRLTRYQIDGGTQGLIVCGTTGEAATMTAEEQSLALRTVIDEAKGEVPVIAGSGTNNTRTSIQATDRVRQAGADAALVVTPYYNKPNQAGILAHFRAVEANTDIPIVLYDVPGRTVVRMDADTVAELAALPSVVGLKDATADMSHHARVVEACGDKIALLSGDDFTTIPYVFLGGHGCVSVVANFAPRLVRDAVDAARDGNRESARAIQQRMVDVASVCFSSPNPAPTKRILEELGLCQRDVRLPLVAPDESELSKYLSAMNRAGVAKEG
jgi:4-hydroxy-tetrahydrodipicolinate synthase